MMEISLHCFMMKIKLLNGDYKHFKTEEPKYSEKITFDNVWNYNNFSLLSTHKGAENFAEVWEQVNMSLN